MKYITNSPRGNCTLGPDTDTMKRFFIIFTLLAIVALAIADADNACPKKCNRVFAPLCASDADGTTRTFNNQCLFDNFVCANPSQNMRVVSQGACP